MGIGGPRGFLQLFLGRIGFAEAQIVRHGAMDQISVLHDHRDVAAQHVERQAANIMAAQQNAPLLRIEEAQQEPDHGGFAGTTRSHQPHLFRQGSW